MVGFRKKIFLSNLIVLLVVVALLIPVVNMAVNHIMRNSMTNRGKGLIRQLQMAPDLSGMIEMMKTEPGFLFLPVTLLDGNARALYYHTYLPTDGENGATQVHEPEVLEAIQKGSGFNERLSPYFKEKFYFLALAFTAHGEHYILHINFNSQMIDQLKVDFEIGILIVAILLLAVTSFSGAIIIQYATKPIQTIIDAIRPFKEGREEFLPRIVLSEAQQGGEFSKLASILNELTTRIQKQIEKLTRQREETADILESIGEGIIATDTSAKVTFVNRTACRMIGVSHEAIFKQTLNTVKAPTHDLTKKCHELILFVLQTSEPIIQTWTVREANPIHLDLIAAPLFHQNGALVVLQDKTSEYKVVEMGKDFISNASHELRTPITIIRGFAETLQDLPDLSQEMLKEITEKIVRTCGRLDKLVRSLLTLSDIENISPDRFKPADLVLLAEGCKHNLLAAHPTAQVSLKSDFEAAPIMADVDLLELAVSNILENAVKYSQPPAQIEMTIYQSNENVCITIKDKGIGISERDIPHIFDRFYTVDKARSRKSGGTGLGLSIVKTIVDKHKGKVTATSEVGKGSTFTLCFKLQPLI